ncbi:MAG: TM2 domain-containing protein [Ruminococcaceae bacterium]|nr:TM2 domain-containing protein [Oscillospiraceae bacterium]MBR3595596.1 TM2 domain-containing protein [Clostridia bacterium]
MVCNNCGAPIEPGQNVCSNCGANVNAAPNNVNVNPNPANSDYLGGKDPTIMMILAIFLGNIGLPYFMFGETKKAIIRIVLCFCTGIGGFVTLIFNILDAIKMSKGEYVIDTEKWF